MELTIDQAIEKGVAAHKEGKLQDAERFYRNILKVQPLHPDANHNLGVLAVSVNKAEAALPFFKTALDSNPKIEQFWLSYIDALIKEEQFYNAMAILQQGKKEGLSGDRAIALEQILDLAIANPNTNMSEQNEFHFAIELRETGKYREAQEWLRRFLEKKLNNPEALSLLSQVLLLDKKDIESEEVLSKAASLNSELPSIYRNQARLLLKQSQPMQALEKAQAAHKRSSNDPETWLVLAACLGANQRDQEALPLIEKLLEFRPAHAEAFANRALIRLRAKNVLGAIKDIETAVSIKPHLTELWALLASLRYQSNNLSGAINALRKANQNEPNNTGYMINLGEFLRQDNKVEEAIALLEGATKLDPRSAKAWANLGVALQQDKNIDYAKSAYEKALAIDPKLAQISSNIGAILKNSGDWDSALQHFKRAVVLNPGLAEAHNNLGAMLQELRRLEEAEASFRQAIALKPKFSEAHNNLGTLLFQSKKYNLAAEQFDLSDFYESKLYAIQCSYLQDEETVFYKKFDALIDQGEINAVIGSLGFRSEFKYGVKKRNSFCRDPLNHVVKIDLNEKHDFENVFVKTARNILTDNSVSYRKQGHLTNGVQTAGNIFSQGGVPKTEIENIIRAEIEKYRTYFKGSEEGFIKSWPASYDINGWLICMQKGGKLSPHMHDLGWITGSVYINVPPKSKINCGNLVLCLSDQEHVLGADKSHQKIVDVVTGNLCLFPSSLHHYTVPFEEKQDRIVLAFDVIPKT